MTAPGQQLTIQDTARKTVGWPADHVSNPTKLSLNKHQFANLRCIYHIYRPTTAILVYKQRFITFMRRIQNFQNAKANNEK